MTITLSRFLFIMAMIVFAALFVIGLMKAGVKPEDFGWLGLALVAAGLAAP